MDKILAYQQFLEIKKMSIWTQSSQQIRYQWHGNVKINV